MERPRKNLSTITKLCLLCAVFVADVCFPIVEASRSGCSDPLGMKDGRIENSQLSSFSHYRNKQDWAASQGRLGNSKAWCSNSNDNRKEYFEIDLLRVRHVSSMDMQGYRGWIGLYRRSYYVKTFTVNYSYDGVTWYIYKANDGAELTFTGNSNANDVKTNQFRDTFVTRFLRIHPKEFYRDMCLRLEFYGCSDEADDCTEYITEPSGSIRSPGYPNIYPHNKDCTWLISVSSGMYIALMFTHFDVYQGANPQKCSNDFVEVRDGLSDISHNIGGKYCNGNMAMLILTPGNFARVHFLSGSASPSSHNGFVFEYLSLKRGLDDVLTAKVCSGDMLALNCSSYDYTINILHAWYQTSHSCAQNRSTEVSSCPPFDAKETIVTHCQHYKECHITLSQSLFNYTCGFERPQLKVFYQCTSKNHKTRAPTPPPTQPTTKAPSTTTPSTTSPPIPSQSLIGDYTSSSTPVSSTDITTTIPPSQAVFSVSTDIPPTTKRTTSSPLVVGKEAQMGGGMSSGRLVAIIVVVIAVIVVTILILLCLVHKKRKNKGKGSHMQIVSYSPEREYCLPNTGKAVICSPADNREYCLPDNNAKTPYSPDREYCLPNNTTANRCPLDYSGSRKGNAYETMNILYLSADNASESNNLETEDVKAYASCPVAPTSPKVTENPLYKRVAPPFSGPKPATQRYELVKPFSDEEASPPDSPLPEVRSIQNPNYENTLPLTTRENALPDANC
ncbi:unnamed protein product [Porites evermanni]|uniref:Uncharacterized protein n=1 Tax=Porites evermanni TaxID=104178 RepID=A0ABN8QK84_9CNID|nr:unnamed protein product [Porites evermanni]